MPNPALERIDLWPNIKINANTPERILRHQANVLKKKSQGYLEAEVSKVIEDGKTTLFFDMIAPKLNRSRYRIFIANHAATDATYPVVLESDAISDLDDNDHHPDCPDFPTSYDEVSFQAAVQVILWSRVVQAKIESFIARTNEVLEGEEMSAESATSA
jgi:hypothetical protein